jgi:hypothetical protein
LWAGARSVKSCCSQHVHMQKQYPLATHCLEKRSFESLTTSVRSADTRPHLQPGGSFPRHARPG